MLQWWIEIVCRFVQEKKAGVSGKGRPETCGLCWLTKAKDACDQQRNQTDVHTDALIVTTS